MPTLSPRSHAAARPLLIVKLGEAHEQIRERLGDFDEWIAAGLHSAGATTITIDPRAGGALPDPSEVAGIVITGSHAMVTHRDDWSVALMPWLVRAVEAEAPLLGICFGHQILAQAMGGTVDNHPGGVEIGTITISRSANSHGDALLGGLPEHFDAQSVHWQSVRVLPPGAVLLAGTEFEPHHAFRIGPCAWGVQFHPEFSDEVLRAYLERLGPELAKEGKDAERVIAGLHPTPLSSSLLPTFARFALAHQRPSAVDPEARMVAA
ncbi:glutamine amidotransferase [Hydrogenophaga sp. PAMC20947]|uniref:glutamine amidotransferase n=1 Tax=Hydrogenophaga sp. PAMC20947 TaxID=2565558 RepID=UPI00109DDBCF|nr:glutamine amidotransferase [Hydrogenophaga sp. PAMC20947]QCB47521.1 glutamine amidotransferase [Hydrogenophaga sp. PAMC20947]